MSALELSLARPSPGVTRPRLGAEMAGWAVPFATLVYLGLSGGGYDTLLRDQFGIATWWLVLIGVAVGTLRGRIAKHGGWALALLGLFLVWTSLSLVWTESSERSFVEIGRVATIFGVLLLGLVAIRPVHSRSVVHGVLCAVGIVALWAVMARLQPGWFPASAREQASTARLSYPLNYWNGLAVLVAMGIPLAVFTASHGRTLLGRSVAAASLPVMILCVALTLSRSGLLASVIATLVLLLLGGRRVAMLLSLAAMAPGVVILLEGASRRAALGHGLSTSLAHRQGTELLTILVLVVIGTACAQLGVSLLDRHATPPRWTSRRPAFSWRGTSVMAGLVIAALIAGGVPAKIGSVWDEFKQPRAAPGVRSGTTFERFGSATGNGRYQYWEAAVRAERTRPMAGRGAGTFEYWWARDGRGVGGFVRDAHSLYLQTLAELGVIGLALIVSFLVSVLGFGALRAVRAPVGERELIAAATAAIFAFSIGAAVEWVWQITLLPVAAMVLAAVVLVPSIGTRPPRWVRPSLLGLSVVVLSVMAVSAFGAGSLSDSQVAAARGDVTSALRHARQAAMVQPFAATPRAQEALVLEGAGDLRSAAMAAAQAAAREPTNWRMWLIRSRIEAERGNPTVALRFFKRARRLNPYSPIFTGHARS